MMTDESIEGSGETEPTSKTWLEEPQQTQHTSVPVNFSSKMHFDTPSTAMLATFESELSNASNKHPRTLSRSLSDKESKD